ncbi:DUF192 domain-containing protein [Thiohalophilus sp.]|uniref:DUF192 domain-containing protein n=1 Tax=Thiohalophilus sp. TaxID=3028392 RepID=UPI002ACE6315|nr:DUF192 domain-containing protein [Thiohalophilus sp.]MDZ7803528.1 DUF192 domain-containing protein [Thiohalophilus sp.]
MPDRCRQLARVGAALLVLASPLALSAGHALESAQLTLAGEHFQVELAISNEEKRRGLMHRDRLAAGSGMLFIYATPQPTRFWNKNVRFPIDILYFDEHRAFLRADTHVPPCPALPCPVYQSGQPVKYVLELPAGSRQRLDLQAGQRFLFRSGGTPQAGSP